MKRLIAVALAFTTCHAIADDTTRLPAMVEFPLVITTVGEQIKAKVENWGSLSSDQGAFTRMKSRVVADLVKQQCQLIFEVQSKGAPGVYNLVGENAKLECADSYGNTKIANLKGWLVNTEKMQGIAKPSEGQQIFFIPTEDSAI